MSSISKVEFHGYVSPPEKPNREGGHSSLAASQGYAFKEADYGVVAMHRETGKQCMYPWHLVGRVIYDGALDPKPASKA